MAYLALYRKWRPQTFDEVVGQKHISLPLSRAVLQDRIAHAYLFSGPRGTGKTSMAKILAKAVNCEHPIGSNPCNTCRTCEEITSGASLDVYEIDAASNRGIEEIRALKESVRSLPSVCKKKVYIIDEVHMLTKEAFNALLKTLEEPPAHVLFILATTEPEKIPLTILSRCQRYEFRRISVGDIKEHLLHVAQASGFSLTGEAADLIAIRAEGGLRDALSLLDQCSSAADTKKLTAPLVYDLLGLTGKDRILSLAEHILRRESGAALSEFSSILQSGKEPVSVLSDLLSHFRDVMLAKIDPDAPELTVYGAQKPHLLQESSSLPEEYVDALFESLHESLAETKRSVSPRMNAEMGLLRLCRLRHSRTLEGLLDRLDALEKQSQQRTAAEPAVSVPEPPAPVSVQPPAPYPETPGNFSDPFPVPLPEEENIPSPEPPSPAPSLPKKPAPPVAAKPVSKKEPAPMPPLPPASKAPSPERPDHAGFIPPAQYPALWKKVLAYFQAIPKVDMFVCFGKCELIYVSAAQAVIVSAHPYIAQACNSKAYKKITADAFQKITGQRVLPHTILKGSPEETEARLAAEEAACSPSAPIPKPTSEKAVSSEYERIEKSDIPEKDLNDPILASALKIAPDYDIYEKK